MPIEKINGHFLLLKQFAAVLNAIVTAAPVTAAPVTTPAAVTRQPGHGTVTPRWLSLRQGKLHRQLRVLT